MNGPRPMDRVCATCGETKRCRFTGLRWLCAERGGCWDKLFPRGEDDAA